MSTSTADLRRLLQALRAAFCRATTDDPPGRDLVDELFGDLAPPREVRPPESGRPPACRCLERAVARADQWREGAALVRAFAALAPSLPWYRRAGSEAQGDAFHDGHANAVLVGPDGLGERSGATVGVSLLAPGVRYPDHRHPPEELYLVLSPGRWRRGTSPWFEPGIGGIVHNPPGIVHAMRADEEPLLAIWCLLDGSRRSSRSSSRVRLS